MLRRHVVLVLIDRMDLATARAIQYARTLTPDELRAVHFAVDPASARRPRSDWSRLGLSRLPLDIIECPDRRLARAALELAADTVADGHTECTVLLPRRGFAAGWSRLLHDRSADGSPPGSSQLPHVNATIVPFQLTAACGVARSSRPGRAAQPMGSPPSPTSPAPGPAPPRAGPAAGDRGGRRGPAPAGDRHPPIAEVAVAPAGPGGRAGSGRSGCRPGPATSNLECTLVDGTGAILLVFQGRPPDPRHPAGGPAGGPGDGGGLGAAGWPS